MTASEGQGKAFPELGSRAWSASPSPHLEPHAGSSRRATPRRAFCCVGRCSCRRREASQSTVQKRGPPWCPGPLPHPCPFPPEPGAGPSAAAALRPHAHRAAAPSPAPCGGFGAHRTSPAAAAAPQGPEAGELRLRLTSPGVEGHEGPWPRQRRACSAALPGRSQPRVPQPRLGGHKPSCCLQLQSQTSVREKHLF